MRVLKIVLISFLVVCVLLVVGVVVAINVVDINQFKPQIIEQAGKALARQVDFQDAHLGIGLNGIGVKINGLTIAEDPAFGSGRFLTVKGISVGVDVIGYLLTRRISITAIAIDAPSVTIIRAKDGAINAQTIAKPAAPSAAAGASVQPAASSPAAVAALPALLISSLRGQNGTVRYIDRTFDPPINLDVKNVEFTVNRLSLTDPFPFVVQAAVFSAPQNIKVEGKCQLDMKTLSVRVFDLAVHTDLSRLVLPDIPKSVPLVPAQALPAELKGGIDVTVRELSAGVQGLTKLNSSAALSGGLAKFDAMAVPVKNITAKTQITEKDMAADSFSAAVGNGAVKGSGGVKNYLAGQDFNFEFVAEKLSLADLIAPQMMPVQLEGVLGAKGQVKGHGFTPEALRTNLVGEASAEVDGAKLKGLNVMRAVLDKMTVIPGLGESIEAGLPDQYKQRLAQKDTVLSDFKVPVTVVNGRVIINDTTITSEGMFTFQAKGEAGLDGTFNLEGSFLVAQELSQAMARSAPQMKYLLNDQQMVYIPLKISGAAGTKVQFTVDAAYITKKLIENQARQQMQKGLNQFFGSQQEGQSSSQGQSQQNDSSRSDAGKAVNGLLDKIFK